MLIINRLYIIIFLTVTISASLHAQWKWEERIYSIDEKTMHSGVAMGFTDLNGDALDDLIVLDDTRKLHIHYQTEGHTDRMVNSLGLVSFEANWSLQAADVDGNGIQDIFISGSGGMRTYMGQSIVPTYTPRPINTQNFLSQGSNFADIDGDGDLDLFVCDDDKENFIALNDGQGQFTQINNFMDFSTIPASDGSGNYGSMWSDFDRDGDLDLYISKCRLGTSPGDPERTNQFFLNTGNGFERIYDYPELLSNDQSWVADFIDVDNDGDWDLLLANHHAPMNLFIRQDDGTFVDEAAARGIALEAGVIQLVSADFDNDGDVDVFVAGTDHILFENDGNGYFIDANFPDGGNQIESATCGDIDNDGYLDIYAGYAQLYNNPTIIPDRLIMNRTAGNNFVKFSLRSMNVNKYAIGATVELYTEGRSQIREIRSGESYGINKSNIVHFGIGQLAEIDSVKIYWPSGLVEVHELLLGGFAYQVTEGESIMPIFNGSIRADKSALCVDDTVRLTGPTNGDEYRWSTGDTTANISVFIPGMYTLRLRMGSTWLTLPSFNVAYERVDQPQVHVFDGSLKKCAHDEVIISTGGFDHPIEWNTGAVEPAIALSAAGSYHFKEWRSCGVYYSDTVAIVNYFIQVATVQNDTVAKFSSAILRSSNEESIWVTDTFGQEIIWTGDEFLINELINDSLVFNAAQSFIKQDAISVGLSSPDPSEDGYHINTANAGVNFNVLEECFLDEVTVFCKTNGPRTITIHDVDSEMEVIRSTYSMNMGFNTLDLNIKLLPGFNYQLSTDENENIQNFGFPSPDFMRSNAPVNYPFKSRFLEITGTTFPTSQYYYFYNWQVRPLDLTCHSHWQPVWAVVDRDVAIVDKARENELVVFPNPSTSKIHISLPQNGEWIKINVYDQKGVKLVEQNLNHQTSISIDNLPAGLFVVEAINRSGNLITKKVVIQK